jgi:hypothetical protein
MRSQSLRRNSAPLTERLGFEFTHKVQEAGFDASKCMQETAIWLINFLKMVAISEPTIMVVQ